MVLIESVRMRCHLAWSKDDSLAWSIAFRRQRTDPEMSSLGRRRRYGGRQGFAAAQSHLSGGYRVFFRVMMEELDSASIGDDGQAVADEVTSDFLREHSCADVLQLRPREAVCVECVAKHADVKAGVVRNDRAPFEECPDARPQ